jgi:4-amino-4-deoxy-L-arabinose transferase-like glycosyltransferase
MHTKSTEATNVAARCVGALLCVQVAIIHVIDQGGIPGTKTPAYVGVGYWILEILGIVTAAALITNRSPRSSWFVAIGVGVGPLIGYILSRGPGLPGYTDDVGNWGEPLGVFSLVAEAILIVLAVTFFLRSIRQPVPETQVSEPEPSSVS